MNAANPFTRRRFIGITAAVAAVAAVPWAARSTGRLNAAAEGIAPVTWRGIALGADAQMRLYHPDRHFALRLIESAVAEVARLEKIFSLYRDDSQLVRLNRAGRLSRPSAAYSGRKSWPHWETQWASSMANSPRGSSASRSRNSCCSSRSGET